MPIYEKKAEKLRVRKTPAAKRTTYTYPIYDGSTITLIPGKTVLLKSLLYFCIIWMMQKYATT